MRAMELNRPLIRAALGGETITFSAKGKASIPAIPISKPVATVVDLQVPLKPENTPLFKIWQYGFLIFCFSFFTNPEIL